MRKILSFTLALLFLSTVSFGQAFLQKYPSKETKTLQVSPYGIIPNSQVGTKNMQTISDIGYFDEEESLTNIGFGADAAIQANGLAYFPASVVASHAGESITQIDVSVVNDGASNTISDLKVCVWTDTTGMATGTATAAYEQVVTNIANGWNEVSLTTPYVLGTDAVFVGYSLSGVGYVMSCEASANHINPDGYGDMIESAGIFHLSQIGCGDLAIRVFSGTLETLDAKLVSVNLDSYVTPGMFDVTGTIKNQGSDAITSYDVTYTIDGGAASAVYSVSGVNIASGETAEFTHDVQADLSAIGSHTVEVTISNVNDGSEAVAVLEDNVMSKEVTVVSELVQKKVFYELFTSATCGPCAQANPAIDAVLLDENNADKAVLIKYQVSWPGAGDPYYTAEAGARVQYYSVASAPSLIADGANGGDFSQAYLDAQAGVMSLFKIEGDATYADGNMTANINVTPVFNFDKNLVVQVAVIEKKTTGNVATNGETEFHNVMMKFIENPNGNAISNFVAGTVQNVTVSTSLDGTNVEELADTRLVVWIQDNATKEVYQAQYIDLSTQITDAKLVAVSTVASACDLPADAAVKAVVKNSGNTELSGFTVSYTVNGTDAGTTTYAETLAAGAEVEITLDQTVDLSADGTYEIAATVNATDDATSANNTVSVTVLNAEVESVADGYAEDFTPAPLTWKVENANNDDRTWFPFVGYLDQAQTLGAGHGDTTAMVYFYSETSAADDYLYSTCLELEASKTYRLSFWYRIGDPQWGSEKLEVLIGNDNAKEAMTQTIVDLGEINDAEYTQKEAVFTVSESGVYYIGFHVYSDANKHLVLVDDINLSEESAIAPEMANDLNIYPNPTTGLVKVEGVEGAQIIVYNIVGEVVYSNANASQLTTVDLSSNNAGNYVVKVIKDNKVSTQKITLTK